MITRARDEDPAAGGDGADDRARAVKMTSPNAMTRRRPRWSLRVPKVSMRAAKVRA